MSGKIYPWQKEILDFMDSQPKNTKLAISYNGRGGCKVIAISKKSVFIYKGGGKWEAV